MSFIAVFNVELFPAGVKYQLFLPFCEKQFNEYLINVLVSMLSDHLVAAKSSKSL